MDTISEKRRYLINEVDTLDLNSLNLVINYIDGLKDNETMYSDATDKEVDDALDYVNKNFSKAMERLAQ